MQKPDVTAFYEPRSGSVQYVVADLLTRDCVIIDPVLDYDEKSGQTATTHADALLDFIAQRNFNLVRILDTHPHADHFSAAHYLKTRTGIPTAIGAQIKQVQAIWRDYYNWPDLPCDGSQWDHLFEDGETFKVGSLDARVIHSPGHTLASVTYIIGDAAFIHDTLFMPDSGTARADFPGGDAVALWQSIQTVLQLPRDTRLFTGHDYCPNGRAPKWESRIDEQIQDNIHLSRYRDQESFVAARQQRDATLPIPKLMLHALQVNIRGGRLPEPEDNGQRYIKIPLGRFDGAVW
ncbi:MBL fold metallo-hydrolase [Pseudochrobactrum sp. MP213Fo]|uniref:MBL fold metallo-hydrolase n=1 Tax=Pseudochrobactrum sp. MP213Fo TaxID=3022250 RepID=UPI003B9F0513